MSKGAHPSLITHHSSPNLGGGERDRTDDPLLAKQVLSQLSYTPRIRGQESGIRDQSVWCLAPPESPFLIPDP